MKITLQDFTTSLNNQENKNQNIIFMGMSGAGKTYWARQFAESYHYPHIEFDDLIGRSEQLSDLVRDYPGRDMAEKMGHYFGMPWTPGFQEREDMFLEIERGFMAEFPAHAAVLDLTGSAIYHPEELAGIARSGLVVYLETDQSSRQKMFENFIKNPKPVCWSGVYRAQDGESNEQALARCYPLLLETRAKLYEKYADVTLPFDVHKNVKRVDDLAAAIRERL